MATESTVADVKVGDGEMAVFTYRPEGAGKRPAVNVIEEIWGVNDHMKDIAGRFAAAGYVAAAPDLFHRSGREITVPFDQMPGGGSSCEARYRMTISWPT